MKWGDADGLFRRAMRELCVPFLRRWIMWAAVRWAALFRKGGRTGWLPDAPLVLVTLFAFPIVAPPGAVILVALFVFYLAELVAWAPLKVNERAMVRLGRDPRK